MEFGRTTKIYLEVVKNEQTELRAWKLFGLVPLMLMQKRQSWQICRAQQKMTRTQERSHAAGVDCEQTSGVVAGDLTGSRGVRPRRRGEVGCQIVGHLSEVCAFGIVSRSWWVHPVPAAISILHHGHDCFAETGGRHPWHCNKYVIPQICQQNDGQTVHDKSGTSMCAVLVRVVQTQGHHVRVATDHDPEMTVMSISGIGEDGRIGQHEGGEQGDVLVAFQSGAQMLASDHP